MFRGDVIATLDLLYISVRVSEVNLTFFIVVVESSFCCLHSCVLLLHLVEANDILVFSVAFLAADPLADREDARGFDELVITRAVIASKLAGDKIVTLISLLAKILAEFLLRDLTLNRRGAREEFVALPTGVFWAELRILHLRIRFGATVSEGRRFRQTVNIDFITTEASQ